MKKSEVNQRSVERAEIQNQDASAPETGLTRDRRARIVPWLSAVALVAVWLFLLPSAAHAQLCTSAPTNMIAWWPGDDHPLDVIGLRNAVLNNATYAPGLVGDSFSFAASVARVRVLEDTATDLSRMPRFTIEAWIKPASLGNSIYPTIYSEGNRLASIGLNPGTGLIESWINGANRMIATNTPLQTGQWAHVALVYNSGVSRQLYVNGLLAGVSNAPAVTDDSSGAGIGHVTLNDPSTQFLGEIDEVSLYSRALGAAEIAAIASAGLGGKCFPGGPGPVFVTQPASQTGFLGDQTTFIAVAMGTPRPTYQWLFRQTGRAAFTNLAGQTAYTLTLTTLTFADDGEYALQATSTAGTTNTAVARLTVKFCTDTPTNLIAWWPGDGSGLDVTGNHHGAVWGGVTYPQGVVSNGPAFGLNGTDSYVAVPDSSDLSPHVGTNGQMTVEMWILLTQYPGSDRVILSKGDPGRWEYIFYLSSSGMASFYVYEPAGSTSIAAAGGPIPLNDWHHLVGVLKKGEFIRLYLDGALLGESTNATVASVHGPTTLYLGCASTGYFFNGRLDEVALYDRALEVGEIAALWAGGEFGKCAGAPTPAPFFAVQPADKYGYLANSVTLEGFAIGTPRPHYQWQFWGTNLPSATNATLALSDLKMSDAGPYTIVATNI